MKQFVDCFILTCVFNLLEMEIVVFSFKNFNLLQKKREKKNIGTSLAQCSKL